MKRGTELISDVESCRPQYGSLAFWWLGQHGFIVKSGSIVLYIDPYLSPHQSRLVEPLISPADIQNADLVLGSHDHSDHIDRPVWPAIAASSPNSIFVVPEAVRNDVINATGIAEERILGLDDRVSINLKGVTITGIAAAHEFLVQRPHSRHHVYLGYVIELNGCCIYHAGDTCRYDGMLERLRRWNFDVVFLPINGRDARRYGANCLGNMTYQEAADLGGELKPRLTVPAHYDMFAFNSENPEAFCDYMRVKYPHLRSIICHYGERVELSASPSA